VKDNRFIHNFLSISMERVERGEKKYIYVSNILGKKKQRKKKKEKKKKVNRTKC